jgi:hypothetical protein
MIIIDRIPYETFHTEIFLCSLSLPLPLCPSLISLFSFSSERMKEKRKKRERERYLKMFDRGNVTAALL